MNFVFYTTMALTFMLSVFTRYQHKKFSWKNCMLPPILFGMIYTLIGGGGVSPWSILIFFPTVFIFAFVSLFGTAIGALICRWLAPMNFLQNKHLAEILLKEINLNVLEASSLSITVQPDCIVAQLKFHNIASKFGEKQVLSIVDSLRSQIENIARTHTEFSKLDYAVSDPAKLWVFILKVYGVGSSHVCNCRDNKIEWN